MQVTGRGRGQVDAASTAEGRPDVELLLTGDATLASLRGLDCRVSVIEPGA